MRRSLLSAATARKHSRFAEVTMDLATEGVEIVGGCGAIDDLHVAVLRRAGECKLGWVVERTVVAELEESFHTTARVFWTLSVEPVTKLSFFNVMCKQHQKRLADPCGKLRTRPDLCSHLRSPEAMYWSMMICQRSCYQQNRTTTRACVAHT